ncbi:MAG: amphi-Trp domain-containing protein, partial [Myxococcales bacterium]|nr:amphi-Trp domain-containing protein [Myxococcales bacterium]
MGGRKRRLEHEVSLSRAGAAEILEKIRVGLLRGEMKLRRGDEGISLRPEGLVEVALRVRC